MKSVIFVSILSFLVLPIWCQLRLEVEGNASIDGNLTINNSSTLALTLKALNPLVEFRNTNNDYLAFIQTFGSDLYLANRVAGRLYLRTSNINRMTIADNGNIGIGTTVMDSKLTINGFENNGTIAGLEILSGSQKMIMDGNEIDCTSGGLHLNFNSQNDLLFRTATRRSEITMTHNVGSGTSNGVTIHNPGSNNAYWTMYSTNHDGNLELYYQGDIRGEFVSGTGAYVQISDRRLKQKIQPLDGVLEKVARLRPTSYSFRSGADDKPNLGFIAQEVQQLFPELVNQSKIGDTQEEILMLDYSGFSVIAIAAIQEMLNQEKTENAKLKAENREMQNQLSSLADRLDQIEYQLSNCCLSEGNIWSNQQDELKNELQMDRPHLAQNVPNPFWQETSIQYYLPKTVEKAEILLTDQNGRRIRSFSLDQIGYGDVKIEGGFLSAGTYYYSLVVDGSIWKSLRMVVIK